MEQLRSMLDGLRSYWENLTERERRMLAGLGAVGAALIVVVPVFLLSRSIGQLEDDNARLSSSLRLLSRSRGEIAAMRAERTARAARYAQGAPGDSWLTAQVEEHGLSVSRVNGQPARVEDGFTINTRRVSIQNTGLRSAIVLLTDLKNSRYPVTIEQVHVDHNQAGDRYNFEIGVRTYAREGAEDADAGVPAARPAAAPRGRNTAGPPAP
jgi:type II secretory pathway component PulM